MKKLLFIALTLNFALAFGQNDCKFCDSVLQLQRQTGNPDAMSKYNSSCFTKDTIFLDSTYIVKSKAICTDLETFTTFSKKTKKFKSSFKVENKDTIFFVSDKMPSYPSGEIGMIKFLQKNIEYPRTCLKNKIAGTVYITFTVDEKGNLKNIYPLRSPNPDLTYEAIRVIKLMPQWTPGEIKGKPVKIQFNLPIKFSL